MHPGKQQFRRACLQTSNYQKQDNITSESTFGVFNVDNIHMRTIESGTWRNIDEILLAICVIVGCDPRGRGEAHQSCTLPGDHPCQSPRLVRPQRGAQLRDGAVPGRLRPARANGCLDVADVPLRRLRRRRLRRLRRRGSPGGGPGRISSLTARLHGEGGRQEPRQDVRQLAVPRPQPDLLRNTITRSGFTAAASTTTIAK